MCRADTPHLKASHFEKYNYNIFNVWWLTQFSETKAICLSCLKTTIITHVRPRNLGVNCVILNSLNTHGLTRILKSKPVGIFTLFCYCLYFSEIFCIQPKWHLNIANGSYIVHKALYVSRGQIFSLFLPEKHGGQYLRSGDCDEPGMCILRKHVPHSSVLMFWR